KLRFVDDEGNPLVSTGIVGSDSEVEVVFDETANLRISTSGKDRSDKGYGTNSLLKKWRDSYPDNDDYDPYDDDILCNPLTILTDPGGVYQVVSEPFLGEYNTGESMALTTRIATSSSTNGNANDEQDTRQYLEDYLAQLREMITGLGCDIRHQIRLGQL
ncbi:hypothetical protein Tco_0515164, partial [Tanacetum coccineum]